MRRMAGKEFHQSMRKHATERAMETFPDFKSETYKNYEFQTWTNQKNQPVLNVYRGMSGKAISRYYYISTDHRQVAINGYKEIADRIEKTKADKKKSQSEVKNTYKVDEILYDSWGYGQTNIDFYQITEVLSKSIKVRAINSKLTDRECGHDQGYLMPIKDSFSGAEFLKRIQAYGNEGKTMVKSTHGWISKWDGQAVWSSWYH